MLKYGYFLLKLVFKPISDIWDTQKNFASFSAGSADVSQWVLAGGSATLANRVLTPTTTTDALSGVSTITSQQNDAGKVSATLTLRGPFTIQLYPSFNHNGPDGGDEPVWSTELETPVDALIGSDRRCVVKITLKKVFWDSGLPLFLE